jgi:hypothetical protein
MSTHESDPSLLLGKMQEGVEVIDHVRERFNQLGVVRDKLAKEVDLVAEAEAFFEELESLGPDETMRDIVLRRAAAEQAINQAGYAELLSEARHKVVGVMLKSWSEQDDIKAFIGAPITLRANDEARHVPTMTYNSTQSLLRGDSYISGEIKAVSLHAQGTIILGPGQYGVEGSKVSARDGNGGHIEGFVDTMFSLDNGVAEPRVRLEAGIMHGKPPGEILTAA